MLEFTLVFAYLVLPELGGAWWWAVCHVIHEMLRDRCIGISEHVVGSDVDNRPAWLCT